MGDETTTGTDAGASTQDSAEKQAPEKTAEQQDRSKDLENRLAAKGREAKAAEERASAAEARAAELQAERDELWYSHKANDAEKEQFRKEREQKKAQKEDPEKVNLANENALLRAIAQEANPAAKKALSKMYDKATKANRFPDSAAVAALRESFEDDDQSSSEGDKEPDEKEPPKVNASRGSQANGPSIDQQITETEKAVREGKATTADLYPLYQQRDALRAAARRG